ncbi:phosphotransferase enzyme family protein [Xanthobacter autotrophicus]|uniref:phosphotransferase enzyme family protein n=1 Tax=Xanthobacter autotrophicus TaxID=280 RepID=UPI0024A7A246|nr:phosphotransferase [Xanthobacter autotrophicus]MDI4657396.1 phosphotransferase [Xanthobacter autotrophicus]
MLYDAEYLTRIEDLIRVHLPAWGLPPDAALSLLSISENATFRATSGARDLVLRVYRPGYHTPAEIRSELAWIEALRADDIVPTPRIIPTLDARRLVEIDDGGTPRRMAAFAFVPGAEPQEGEDLPRWFRHLGGIHARLHAHARGWARPQGFTRKVWDFESMLGARPLWGDFRAALGLDAPGRVLLERTAGVLKDRLAPLSRPDSFGLIHADLRLANLLAEGERLTLIDFDDCGFSWFLYDFAAAVSFIEQSPRLPELKAAWLAGYRTRAPVPAGAEAALDVFVMLRRMLLTAWVASHAETPTAQAMGVGYTDGTLALAEGFLARQG